MIIVFTILCPRLTIYAKERLFPLPWFSDTLNEEHCIFLFIGLHGIL